MYPLFVVVAELHFLNTLDCGHVFYCGSLIWYFPLDVIKLITRYILSGRAWALMTEQRVLFTRKKNYGRDHKQAQWATISRSASKVDPKNRGAKLNKAKSFIQGIQAQAFSL